jgi:parallel beta-helix repeat protein
MIAGFSSLLLLFGSLATASAAACNRVAAPGGADGGAGTESTPYATVQRLVETLTPGQTGCLRAGVYEQDVTLEHGGRAGAPIILRSYPGERATLVGRLRLVPGASYTTISDLALVGLEHGHQCSKMCASPTVDANHTSFINDDVTNDHADTICFLLGDSGGVWGTADNTTIEHDRIHDCGALPATNYDHGIYVEESHGSRIVSNLIYDNADRGIQLYPQAIGTLIRGNVIAGNGEGVDFGASGQQSSNDNTVEDNIITGSNVLYNVMSAYGPGDRVGTGNVVRDNCVGGGAYDNAANPGGIRFDHSGFHLSGNVLAVPIFIDRAQDDFSLAANSPCNGVLAGRTTHLGRLRAGGATVKPQIRIRRVRWLTVGARRTVRVTGVLRPGSAVAPRCGTRAVTVRALRRGRWFAVAWGATKANCTFLAVGALAASRRVALETLVAGVGRSAVIVVRRPAGA